MEMGVGTKLNHDGSGVFSMAVALDREFIDGLRRAEALGDEQASGGIQEFEKFFAGLRDRSWSYRRSETPGGDLALRASCTFPNSAGFDRCLSQLSSVDVGKEAGELRNFGLSFDFGITRGFLKTESWFAGTADLSGPDDERLQRAIQQLQSVAADTFRFEIRADLPGAVKIAGGQGQADGGVALWRPRVGETLVLRATASAYNPGAVLALVVPALVAIGFVAWSLARRRARRTAIDDGFSAASVAVPQEPGFEPAGRSRDADQTP